VTDGAPPPPAAPPAARIPSLGRRLVFGTLLLIPLLILWVGLPTVALSTLNRFGVESGISVVTVSIVGVVLSILGAVRYVVRPTRAYGPVAALLALLVAAYLLALVPHAHLAFPVSGEVTISVSYGTVLTLFAIVPAIRLVSALVTTAEDALHPGERLPFDFPP
jgi:hypothetical protein